MSTESTVSLEFTDKEIEWLLMCLSLARNSPQMSDTVMIDALLEKIAAHSEKTTITATDDSAENSRDE